LTTDNGDGLIEQHRVHNFSINAHLSVRLHFESLIQEEVQSSIETVQEGIWIIPGCSSLWRDIQNEKTHGGLPSGREEFER